MLRQSRLFTRTSGDNAEPQRPERRHFLNMVGRYGFTTALIGALGGSLFSESAMAAISQEEAEREKAADTVLVMATGYRLGASRAYPIMQLNFKENLQNFSRGKLYVRLQPGGQLGAGGALITKVQNGTIAMAQHSMSNLSAFAPEVDLINIPYWCGENQHLINLVTSDTWKDVVHGKVEDRGFKVLSYVCIDPRTVAVRKGLLDHPVRTPDDIRGIKFRVPSSQILQKVYKLAGANPTPVAWGETSSAMKQGVADALDPSVQALFVYGFTDVLASISTIQSVPDAQVYTCNKQWFDARPKDVQDAIMRASDVTFRENLAKVPAARAYAYYEMRHAGIDIYSPTEDEIAQWKAKCGHQLETWNDLKVQLAGSMDNFNALLEATGVSNGYHVDSNV
ncbi:TRAP transporter substrate-binding protein [Modicisalibacter tunisiensis]|uniref:TRAP transporter substrate-binding protein n=1 Tax=Modicisalibacter tunisiensis TaxID=390637 RepID=UPI00079151EF|nr:TRAP transporter substrate-binding protein [Modicisalibacter tunisiensis]KXS37067.1 MAG: putative TRAP-type C4-dicarboxylate transport system, periplasmic component [Halomonadaceae bacterium T82-2]MBZ9538015.1 TRAP transporter substrate-binding protein [Modicisalibacter tunisiensis]